MTKHTTRIAMKKNLVLVLGLVFLSYPFASCESEDELNALKTDDSPATVPIQNQLSTSDQTYDKQQLETLSCDDVETTTLYAGQNIEVGLIHISNSAETLFVTYDLTHSSWSLKETHLYLGAEEDIPYGKAGNPKIGHFPYAAQRSETNPKEYTYAIPLAALEECFVIIAHGVVEKDNQLDQVETAFGFDDSNQFPGSRWGWFMDYCLQECDDTDESGDEEVFVEEGVEDEIENSLSEEDCLESYAYHFSDQSDAQCFLASGFDQWGWTNQVFYNPLMNYVSGYVLEFPLLASAFQCDIRNSLEVGYVTVRISGGDSRFTANIDVVVTDSTYDLRAVDIYVGQEKYPLDPDLAPTISPEFYNYRETLTDTRILNLTGIPWPVNAHFIARSLLCPVN